MCKAVIKSIRSNGRRIKILIRYEYYTIGLPLCVYQVLFEIVWLWLTNKFIHSVFCRNTVLGILLMFIFLAKYYTPLQCTKVLNDDRRLATWFK